MSDNEMLSKRARLLRELVAEFNHNDLLKTKFREEKRGESEFDKPYHYPNNYIATKVAMENFNMEFLTVEDSNSNWALLQLHGGGFVGTMKNYYRTFAKMYSELGHGMSVLTIDYRVAPENPYPAALEDALTAYEWLLEKGYSEEHIVLAGDSAGGGLAMSLCHYLKDRGRRLPAGIVAMSPWTDLTISGESYEKNYEIDPIFGNTREGLLFDSPYAKDEEKTSPYVSPLFGDFTGFPPMLIQVGDQEMLMSDSISVADKAKNAGVKVKLSVYEGMFHVFQTAMRFIPESGKAWNEVGRFLNILMKRKDDNVLRVALIERNILWEDKPGNLKSVEDMLKAIENRHIDLVLLPEMSFTGFSMNTGETAESQGETVTAVQELADRYNMNVGVGWVRQGEKLAENHYTILAPGEDECLSDYIKIHPFSYADEDEYFVGGEKLVNCRLGLFDIGTAVCYDLRFPELFQCMSRTSDMIVVPANWPASRSMHWKTLLCARAIESQCFVAGINCCGEMNGVAYSGDSAIYDAEGNTLTPFETIKVNDTDKIYIYDIENNVSSVRECFPVKSDRREELYKSML